MTIIICKNDIYVRIQPIKNGMRSKAKKVYIVLLAQIIHKNG